MCNKDAGNNLLHSSSAISISANFYNKQIIVYVEGPDDVSFWDAMFSRVVSRDFYEIIPVNGKEELKPYIEGIERGTIQNVFVATDLDYLLFTGKERSASPYIIYTYGHSIENTMFCPQSIAAYLRRAIKKTIEYDQEVEEWYNNLLDSTKPLLAMDILNCIDIECKYHQSNGQNILLGRGFHYYKDHNYLIEVSSDRISNEIDSHKDFDSERLDKLEDAINSMVQTRDRRFLFQGHFLADAAMNYIRETLNKHKIKMSLSNDALYLSFFDCVTRCATFCHDKQHVFSYIERAVAEYKGSRT